MRKTLVAVAVVLLVVGLLLWRMTSTGERQESTAHGTERTAQRFSGSVTPRLEQGPPDVVGVAPTAHPTHDDISNAMSEPLERQTILRGRVMRDGKAVTMFLLSA